MNLRLLTVCALFFAIAFSAQSQVATNYYVTIGIFNKPDNAAGLTEKAIKQGYAAQHALSQNEKLTYVFVLNTTNKNEAFALVRKLQAETEYKDAWVFSGQLGEGTIAQVKPVIEKKEEPIVEIKPIMTEIVTVAKPSIDSSTLIIPVEEPIVKPIERPSGKPFYFKLINLADNSEVKSGEIHIQEAVGATQYQAIKPGEVVYLEAPKNKRGAYTIATQVAGYSPISTVFNYQNPAGDKGSQDELIIELPLKKAKKGDYIDFNNVRFFKNTSILLPPSQNELDGVVDLLKENPKYKIKIHGHVNGTQDRECFTRGANSSFFATNPSEDKASKGMSPKELSTHRAETVRDYLVSQGIEVSRISTKGEGGKIPLYPESGTLGQYNDRIEIEFIKH